MSDILVERLREARRQAVLGSFVELSGADMDDIIAALARVAELEKKVGEPDWVASWMRESERADRLHARVDELEAALVAAEQLTAQSHAAERQWRRAVDAAQGRVDELETALKKCEGDLDDVFDRRTPYRPEPKP